MGFLDKLLGKTQKASDAGQKALCVWAPADGKVIALEEFPDPVFSSEGLGPGCGILPTGDLVTAPFDGAVTVLADTLHAVGLIGDNGVEVLIHIGVDTVEMNGEGFQACAKGEQKVRRGDPLIRFDREAIKKAGHPDAIAVVVTNAADFAGVTLEKTGDTAAGDPLLQLSAK